MKRLLHGVLERLRCRIRSLALFLAIPALMAQVSEHDAVEMAAKKATTELYIATDSEWSLYLINTRADKKVKVYAVINPDLENNAETKKLLRRGAQIWVKRYRPSFVVVADDDFASFEGQVYGHGDKLDRAMSEWRFNRIYCKKL